MQGMLQAEADINKRVVVGIEQKKHAMITTTKTTKNRKRNNQNRAKNNQILQNTYQPIIRERVMIGTKTIIRKK